MLDHHARTDRLEMSVAIKEKTRHLRVFSGGYLDRIMGKPGPLYPLGCLAALKPPGQPGYPRALTPMVGW